MTRYAYGEPVDVTAAGPAAEAAGGTAEPVEQEALLPGWEERLREGDLIEVVVYASVRVPADWRAPASIFEGVRGLREQAQRISGVDRSAVKAMVRFPEGVRTVSF